MTEDNKTLSGRGGPRQGAGRPKGTTGPYKEVVKKMYSFRLSVEEAEAVKTLLAKMRGKLVILLCLLSLCLPTFAALEGNIQYTEESARQEAFQGVYKFCPFPDSIASHYASYVSSLDNEKILSIQNTDKNKFVIIYKDYPNFAYSYTFKKQTEFTSGGYYCNSINVNYGNKVATYNPFLYKLVGVKFIASPEEEFMFDMNGNLIGHRQGEKLIKYKVNLREMKKSIYSEP